MPRGDKFRYTDKQKHQAERVERSYGARGVDSAGAVDAGVTTGRKRRPARS